MHLPTGLGARGHLLSGSRISAELISHRIAKSHACVAPSTVRASSVTNYTKGSVLDDLPSREARIELVPERDAVAVVQLPAEIDLATSHLRAEVDEPTLRVLHLNAELGDLAQQSLDLARHRIGRSAAVRSDPALEVFEERSRLR